MRAVHFSSIAWNGVRRAWGQDSSESEACAKVASILAYALEKLETTLERVALMEWFEHHRSTHATSRDIRIEKLQKALVNMSQVRSSLARLSSAAESGALSVKVTEAARKISQCNSEPIRFSSTDGEYFSNSEK